MATAITHIVLAEKVFDKNFSDKNKRDFFIGTVFPDIRYLDCIGREKTHLSQISFRDVQNEKNSFMAGFKFHSLVDIINTKFIYSNIFTNSYPQYYLAVDFVEDELLYSKVNNWNEIIDFFQEILPEEEKFNTNVKNSDILKWHQIMRDNFYKAPNEQGRRQIARAVNLSEDVVSKILETTEILKKDKKAINAIEDFYNNFESLLDKN